MLTRVCEQLKRSGWKGVAYAVMAKVLRKPLTVAATVPGAPHPVLIRLRSSDVWTFDEIGGAWAFWVGAPDGAGSSANRVPAVTVQQLLADRGLERLDVLKVDIEGSEREVFSHSNEWIGQVRAVVVELHEGIAPGCGDACNLATRDFGHRWERGENLVVAREAHPWPVAS